MKRPDQERFDMFAHHFETIDSLLREFSRIHGFQLEKNVYRQPCRILRRIGNPELLIDIYQDDHWLSVDYRTNLPHSIAAVAYYEPMEDPLSLWKLSEILLEHKPFSVVQEHLEECLKRAATLLGSWAPEIMMQRGQRLRNLKRESQQGLL